MDFELDVGVAEAIASKDLNNLYLTSRHFNDPERYRAFCALYAVMRVVDDRIDNLPSRGDLSPDRAREHAVVTAWREGVLAGPGGRGFSADHIQACEHPQAGALLEAAAGAMARFPVPLELWQNFFDAMEQDIDRLRFESYQEFLQYSEGAAVAPTTIYLYLIASQRQEKAYAVAEDFELIRCGRHLGQFAYLAHIMRDLASDLATGEEGLIYLARADMAQFGLKEEQLFADLKAERASAELKALLAELSRRAIRQREKGRALLLPLRGKLSPDREFILELIVALYERILAKIEAAYFDPFADKHRLTMSEKTSIAREVAGRCGFALGLDAPP